MPIDVLSWLAAIMVMSVVVLKMLSGHSISGQKREIAQLEKQRDQVRGELEEVRKQRALADENLEFYERRRLESEDELTELQGELVQFEESTRKHLAVLGYDEAFIEEAIRTGELPEDAVAGEEAPEGGVAPDAEGTPETDPGQPSPDGGDEAALVAQGEPAGEYHHPDAALTPGSAVAVVPPTGRDPDRLFLPDAIITELLSHQMNVLDRSVLMQRVRDGGEDLESILETEQYFRLSKVIDLAALIVVNSTLRGSGVGSATCRVVALPSGKILLSTSYEQPGRSENSPEFEPLTRTAHQLAETILSIVRS